MSWKNIISVDIDTDRKDSPVQLGKPNPINPSMTQEQLEDDILNDMATLCEGLCTLIHVAESYGVKKSSDSLRDCIKHLQDGFADASYKGIITKDL